MVAPTRADAGRAFPNLIVQRPEKISHQLRVVHFAKTPAWILQCAGSHPRRRWDHAACHADRRSICSIHPLESERSGGTLGILDATTPPIRAGRRDIDATDACPAGSFCHRPVGRKRAAPTGGLPAAARSSHPLACLQLPSPQPLATGGLLPVAAQSSHPGLLAAAAAPPPWRFAAGSPQIVGCCRGSTILAPVGPLQLPSPHAWQERPPQLSGCCRSSTVLAPPGPGSFRHRTRWQEAGRPDWRAAAGGSTVLAPLGLLAASVTAPAGRKLAAMAVLPVAARLAGLGLLQLPSPHPWQESGRHKCRVAAASSTVLAPLGLLAASVTAPAGRKGRHNCGLLPRQHGPRTPGLWQLPSPHPLAGGGRHNWRVAAGGSTVLAPLGLLAASVTAPAGRKLAATTGGLLPAAARSSHPLACWQLPSPHPLRGSWPRRHAMPHPLAGSQLLQLLPWRPAARCSFVPPRQSRIGRSARLMA